MCGYVLEWFLAGPKPEVGAREIESLAHWLLMGCSHEPLHEPNPLALVTGDQLQAIQFRPGEFGPCQSSLAENIIDCMMTERTTQKRDQELTQIARGYLETNALVKSTLDLSKEILPRSLGELRAYALGRSLVSSHLMGTFHNDLHQGNWMFDSRYCRVNLIDYGCASTRPLSPDRAILAGR